MNYNFVPMNKQYGTEISDNWKFDGEYAIYDYIYEKDDLLDENGWGFNRFAVLNENDALVGELTVSFFEEVEDDAEDDGYVEAETVKNNPDKIYEMWVGFGMRPDLIGKGRGRDFIAQCIDYAITFHNYKGEYVRLGVAQFNIRAIKTYQKNGFEVFDTCTADINGTEHEINFMRKKL